MNNSLKNKIVYETIDFVIFLVVFCIACGVNGLVFTFIGRYRSKRNQKKIDEKYGKLFDEAGI